MDLLRLGNLYKMESHIACPVCPTLVFRGAGLQGPERLTGDSRAELPHIWPRRTHQAQARVFQLTALGLGMTPPEKPVKLASHARDNTGRAQALPAARTRAKSLLENDAYSTMADLAGADAEVSDVSEADPQALLQAMKDLDDMDADLLGLKKSHPASSRSPTKGSGKEELPSNPKPADMLTANEKGDAIPTRKPSPSLSSSGHQYKRFSSEDVEDPLAGLLSDDEEGVTKKPPGTESKAISEKSPAPARDQGPSVPLTPGDTPIRKKEELFFDDEDDLMAALGFGDSPKAERRQTGDRGGPPPARSKLDEPLGRGSASKHLAHPDPGEHQEFKLDRKYQRPQDKEDSWGNEDFIFGAYQPTVGSSESRQSRRQSVSRFLAEGGTDTRGERGSTQSTPATTSPPHPRKGGADWLGLKDEDEDLLPPSPTREPQREGSALSTPFVPHPENQLSALGQHSAPAGLPPSSIGAKPPPEGAGAPATASRPSQLGASEETEEEDWLSHALSRKKSRGLAREEHALTSKGLNWERAAGQPPSSSQPVSNTQGLKQAAAEGTSGPAVQKPPARPATAGSSVTWNPTTLALYAGDSKKRTAPGDVSGTGPAVCVPSSQEPTFPLPESLAQHLLPGTEYQRQLLAAQAQLQSGTAELQAELLQSQARLAELEAQVRKLELERTQHKLLLEGLQQRHQADLELIENAHRSRVKVLETSYQQREERLRRENEELSAQYLSHCQEAEQARAELMAQHQRRLAAAAQEKDQEMERLRELQRASILEMRKDHEEQLQRLKLLKDREIDAVTSATSHTRSLNGVIEQMEKFSSSLNELSSRVEASHLTTAQEWELGIQQQDKQLRALQERLGHQQRDMEEERSRLQEVIAKMEARLNEQSRLLEQERWRVSAEQSKAESTQRALEEQRRIKAQQMAMEREELERAKSALLEEQKSVMHKCGEERRRLAAEWAEFFEQQKLSKERAEREAERAMQVDTQREGTFVNLVKEQAELKIRASELRAKEDQLAAEREALERERQELRLEKERVSAAALRTRLRAEEVERMSQVASEKYEEGERALREAQQVQSEQQARLQLVRRQQEWLQQQEQHVHQEHLSLAQQRLQLDRVRQDLPPGPMGLFFRAQGLAASSPSGFSAAVPAATNPQSSQPPTSLGPSLLHAKLVLLKHTAEQDRDFLENEQFFLETLKKASYNVISHSA
ncbi:fas-binding factor 1 isoform X4 [Artibeus jamaicensis]|uniref:fas-binding factor 1 isoform X4 n=1 Tax=Artibeus jamaicensis TaxID=9417 RepID=UPI00235A6F1A|nr:fas-binding factor 1 isoform X4 [Artibeus jamaicensis]